MPNDRRQEFPAATRKNLALRVAYICSNPECRLPTVGPKGEMDKISVIGQAAHIAAAAPLGPRYDESMTLAARASIGNAIWLCNNCAKLIDTDVQRYTLNLLHQWKFQAETRAHGSLKGEPIPLTTDAPCVEVDKRLLSYMRTPGGFSDKNEFVEFDGSLCVDSRRPIIFWNIRFRFRLKIVNNSNVPVKNVRLRDTGEIPFEEIGHIDKFNNIPSLGSIEVPVVVDTIIEGVGMEVEAQLLANFGASLIGAKLTLSFADLQNKSFETQIEFVDDEYVSNESPQ